MSYVYKWACHISVLKLGSKYYCKKRIGNSLAVQWLGLGAYTARGLGSIGAKVKSSRHTRKLGGREARLPRWTRLGEGEKAD